MRSFSRVLTLAATLALAWGVDASTALVLAQDGTTDVMATPGTGAEEPPVVVLRTDDPTAIEVNEVLATAIVIVLLLIVLFALVELIRYLRESRASYYGIVGEFARKGIFFAPSYVSATAQVPAIGLRAAPGEEGTTVQQQFRVAGPGFAVAGEAAVFNAFLDNSPADGTAWTLRRPDGTAVPADVATIQPATGPTTTFTSATPDNTGSTLPPREEPSQRWRRVLPSSSHPRGTGQCRCCRSSGRATAQSSADWFSWPWLGLSRPFAPSMPISLASFLARWPASSSGSIRPRGRKTRPSTGNTGHG